MHRSLHEAYQFLAKQMKKCENKVEESNSSEKIEEAEIDYENIFK